MCQFTIPFSGPADSLINRAGQEIRRTGGSLNGDIFNGNFQGRTPIGSIGGTYQVVGQEITIVITQKPFLLSCKRIEKELRGVMV
jgi:hypothetical protein